MKISELISKASESKNIIVTGGAGFIGSNLCERLLARGHKVTSIDNYLTSSTERHIDGITYKSGDVSDLKGLVHFSPDIVFHLGEYSRVEESFNEPGLVYRNNKLGIISVLEFCLEKKCKLVYAGSSTKFAEGGDGRHQSPYAWTKASNTELVMNYGRWFGLNYAITYFYNAYGPRELELGRYATLIGIFCRRMRAGSTLPVVRPGTQRRNFTHVSDIVSALELVGDRGEGDGFGIGADRSYTVKEVADLFGGEIEWLPERAGNRLDAAVLSTKTIELGWQPERNLEDYISSLRANDWVQVTQ
jgi:UDP-glucose 4-epimerase